MFDVQCGDSHNELGSARQPDGFCCFCYTWEVIWWVQNRPWPHGGANVPPRFAATLKLPITRD